MITCDCWVCEDERARYSELKSLRDELAKLKEENARLETELDARKPNASHKLEPTLDQTDYKVAPCLCKNGIRGKNCFDYHPVDARKEEGKS